jgi:isoleucyl-tRNA synthetase
LNVKEFEFVAEAGALVSYRILPNNKLLGPKFGARFPAVRMALAALDPDQVALQVESGENVTVTLEGEAVKLYPDEVLVSSEPAAGLAVAADRVVTAAIDTEVTPALRAEGLARELVRRIQDMRKNANFNIEDRITTYYQADGELDAVLQAWGDYIQSETLSTALVDARPPEDAYTEELSVEGEPILLGVKQNT